MKKMMAVIRDGELKLRVALEAKPDGTLWCGQSPLLGRGTGDTMSKEELSALVRAGKFDQISSGRFLRLGQNPDGALVMAADEWDRQQRDARPESEKAYDEVQRLYAEADRLKDSTQEDGYERHFRVLHQADAARAAWREKYPEAATEKKRASLLAQAAHQRSLAQGAMTYDCDGSFSRADQEARRDEFLKKAAEIESQANSL